MSKLQRYYGAHGIMQPEQLCMAALTLRSNSIFFQLFFKNNDSKISAKCEQIRIFRL